MSADSRTPTTAADCAIGDAVTTMLDEILRGPDSSTTGQSAEMTYPVYAPDSSLSQPLYQPMTSPVLSSYWAQSSNQIFMPDYMGGLLPTEQGYTSYMAAKLREAERRQRQLTCPHCERILGNAGSHKRHVGACRKRPEMLAQLKEKSTCTKCQRVLKTPQAMSGLGYNDIDTIYRYFDMIFDIKIIKSIR